MRVGLVRNVGLSAVALLALGLAGCDDNPLDVIDGSAVAITTNPSSMIVPVGVTTLLESRTIDGGSRPTWEDITAALDPTCGAATATIAVAASYEPAVQPPGVFDVTGGSVVGSTCITLDGGGVTASVDVIVVGDDLVIVGDPGTISVFSTFQFAATGFGDGSPVTGLDPADVTWSSDNTAVLSIDSDGLATGNAAGTAVITATWTVAGVVVNASNPVSVDVAVPVPVLISTDVANASAGDPITVTGTGFLVGPHFIFVDGTQVADDPLLAPTIVDATTATFNMPPGASGATEVTIGSEIAPPLGGFSNGLIVTRDTDDDEPGNDDPSTSGVVLTLPVLVDNWIDGAAGDIDDFYLWSPAAGVTVDLGLDWIGESGDLDLLFTDAAFTAYFPVFGCATGNVPEACQGTFPADDYAVWVNDFAHAPGLSRYTLTMTAVP
ncbi:MAG: Ig-like domain-containing protein [Gemmatimonadota bacterium]|nr:Ig-like domain-containing protein [Gemmatimonadota bacterium]MDH3428062.1 Ig-like domain-containing protein [Gemmatimonadota bacterium]